MNTKKGWGIPRYDAELQLVVVVVMEFRNSADL